MSDSWLGRLGLDGRNDLVILLLGRGNIDICLGMGLSPEVLILDEPCSHLDEEGRRIVAELVLRQREEGVVVIATNDPREVQWGELLIHLGSCSHPAEGY